MITIIFVVIALFCAIQAIRVRHLISAALWLAGVSASVAAAMYLLGAQEVAVIELSVGAGLVTILFVFAISVAGAGDLNHSPAVPTLFSVGLMVVVAAVLGWILFPLAETTTAQAADATPFSVMLWETRGMDVLLQVGLIFGAIMCILGLLGEEKRKPSSETAVMHEAVGGNNGTELPVTAGLSALGAPQATYEKEEVV